MSAALSSVAWLTKKQSIISGLNPKNLEYGTLAYSDGTLRFTTYKEKVLFEAGPGQFGVEFPGIYLGNGFDILVGDIRYYVQFTAGVSDWQQLKALINGRAATKQWRKVLEGQPN
jgi:hypothetical protein